MKVRAGTVGTALLLLALAATPALGAEEGCRTGPCHRDVGSGASVHEPLRRGACNHCHKGSLVGHPEREGEEFVFALGGGEGLCYSCHLKMREEGEKAMSVHGPVREGRCLVCHRPHDSSLRRLLRQTFPEDASEGNPVRRAFDPDDYGLCRECHDRYGMLMAKTTTRTAFRNGGDNLHYRHLEGEKGYTCRACHPPHAAKGEHLVGRPAGWAEDFVNYSSKEGGGTCAPGCHVPRVYFRGEGKK